jgi:hypothetical protein
MQTPRAAKHTNTATTNKIIKIMHGYVVRLVRSYAT